MSNDKLKLFAEGNPARVTVRLDPLERDIEAALSYSKSKAMKIAVNEGFISSQCLNCHCFKVQSEVVRTRKSWEDELRVTIRCDSQTIFRPVICPAPLGANELTNSLSNLTSRVSAADLSVKASASAISSLVSRVDYDSLRNKKAESWDGYFERDSIIVPPITPKKTPEELEKELEEASDESVGITKDTPRTGGVAW
ncbi:hypothetical protein MW722_001506 [Acinetobacter baumannii]|uniref:Uncharacterized protein n=6 Tax=Acinetobacter baumannii TaxID=470 RepID=A0AAP1FCI4_ACIBA|nr:hypothetical protein [Acinetobacter baumannii]EMT94600.1 hypothetical protein ABNIH5_00295 [Acinetobacter baumannii ABNIH5]EXB15636.1 hypothetical protein J513_0417 [Acinetobacter baumannii 1397084]EXD24097.1 hypothetical protein J480_2067 [Acinetobacter baumannii 34654]EYD11713.1 hypothetical protein J935_1576 [Acinetobacter baumannii 44362_2]EYU47060.1 hypothetical protein J616_03950 [Acinetobacter baumannii 1457504]KCW29293.1 hypothetical protein J474_3060 [Acinetobacter baumannii 6935]